MREKWRYRFVYSTYEYYLLNLIKIDIMKMIRVNSSNIHSVGYSESVLVVQFLNNTVYEHYRVPERLFTSLVRSSSKGVYYNSNIKDRFRTKRIR